MFGAGFGGNGSIEPRVPDRHFKLESCFLYAVDAETQSLIYDFQILNGMISSLQPESQARFDALTCANDMVNIIHIDQPLTLKAALEISADFFDARKSTGYTQHMISAVGHCHIDIDTGSLKFIERGFGITRKLSEK